MRRRLTPIERIMWTLGRNVPVAFAVTARIRGRYSRAELCEALDSVLRRHSMLGVRVTGGGPMNAWITTHDVPEPPLRVAATTWETAVAEELQKPFDASTGPLTRFVVIESDGFFDLAIVCHHLVGDGLALAYVLRDVVAHLADPAAPAEPVPAPPMHELVKAMPKPRRSERFKQPLSAWPVRPRTLGDEFALVSWELEAGEGAALQERARAEQTSVHAALGVAGLRALADLDGGTERQLFSPVNMRPLLPALPEGACGDYAIEIFTWFDVAAEADFWASSRHLKQLLRRQTAPDRLLRQVRLLSLTNVLPNKAFGKVLRNSCKPYPSFTFSNLGRLPFATGHGDFRIEAMHAAVHMGTLSNGLLAATAVDDRICLSLSTTGSGRPAGEQMMKGMFGHLRAALG